MQTSDCHSDIFIRLKSIKSKQATFTLKKAKAQMTSTHKKTQMTFTDKKSHNVNKVTFTHKKE